MLEDDEGLQSADNIAPLVVEEVADDIGDIIAPVTDAMTTENITELNARVQIDLENPADVARDFVERNGLL